MLCSICRQVEIVLNGSGAATCANNHIHCENCLGAVSESCLICTGRLYKYNGFRANNTRIWSPEMIREWSNKNAVDLSISEDSLDGGANNGDAASMRLLYSRRGACGVESLHQSNSVPFPNHSIEGQFPEEEPFCSKPFQNLAKADNLSVVKKDTRQTLVEQTKQDLRNRLMDEIFKSYSPDQKPKLIPQKNIRYFRTIGVSTESTPKLHSLRTGLDECPNENEKALQTEDPQGQCLYNGTPAKYLIMNVDTRSIKTPRLPESTQKQSYTSGIDEKLQQIMGTLLESVKPPSKEDKHLYKFLREKFSNMPLEKLDEIISSIYSQEDEEKVIELQVKNNVVVEKRLGPTLIPNCRRAFYNPPTGYMPDTVPSPQFQLIKLCNVNINKALAQMEIVDGTLNIPRTPVICPISTCQRAFFVSDFIKHIAVDHTKVPMEGIHPQQCKNFFLDPKLIHFGKNRCQVLLLVKEKIKNLGHERFKDFIPVLVMATRLRLLEICSRKPRDEVRQEDKQNFVMIWLTGIMPTHLPLFFSLTVWARSGPIPFCHLAHSGRLYSIRESQSPDVVRQSGQMLLLSNNQINFLTNGGRRMLELQFSVH